MSAKPTSHCEVAVENSDGELQSFFPIDLQRGGAATVPADSAPVPAWKRPLDLLILLIALPLILPIALLIAGLIFVCSPGPVLFVQERIGHGRRRFPCYKFRTMRPNCEVSTHDAHLEQLQNSEAPMRKLDAHDPRLLPLARYIRALGLDELPQLLNVARGEMSFVGPRPCTPRELDRYQPWQMERFGAIPGLTGLWQVRGKNRTSFRRMVELDIKYKRNPSLFLDFQILAMTPVPLFHQLAESLFHRRGPAPIHPLAANPTPEQSLLDR